MRNYTLRHGLSFFRLNRKKTFPFLLSPCLIKSVQQNLNLPSSMEAEKKERKKESTK
jgi:hypothetical protein